MNPSVDTKTLEAFILDHLNAKPQIKRWVLAFSGGLDSSVLLHLLVLANRQLSAPKPIVAVHINHNLSPNAMSWQQHCEQTAKSLGVECIVRSVSVVNQGQGIESAAREQRYRAFAELLQAGDCLVAGHHQDDQAETFLLRLLRGAGVQGLGAMVAVRNFEQGQLWRPLLEVSKERLEAYAREQKLHWVDDESNNDTVFDRNFLRQEVIPLLSSRWRQVKSRLALTAEHMQSSQQLLNDLAQIDMQAVVPRQERYGVSLDLLALKTLSPARINNLLRYWCLQEQLAPPNAQQLQEIQRQLLSQETMLTQAVVAWGAAPHISELRQFQQRLYLMPALAPFAPRASGVSCSFDKAHKCDLQEYGSGVLSFVRNESAKAGLSTAALANAKSIVIRWRSGGERCTPAGKKNSQLLKKLLQEYQLETWLRDRVPLLYIDDQLAAVGDLWVCESFSKTGREQSLGLQWVLPSITAKDR